MVGGILFVPNAEIGRPKASFPEDWDVRLGVELDVGIPEAEFEPPKGLLEPPNGLFTPPPNAVVFPPNGFGRVRPLKAD